MKSSSDAADPNLNQHMSIREASALSGLPASTIRFYEKERVIPPIKRDEIGHRYFDQEDVNFLIGVACVASTGMSLPDLRDYMQHAASGHADPEHQKSLLEHQLTQIETEQSVIRLRKKFVSAKIDYWNAVEARSPEDLRATHKRIESIERNLTRKLADVEKSQREEKESRIREESDD